MTKQQALLVTILCMFSCALGASVVKFSPSSDVGVAFQSAAPAFSLSIKDVQLIVGAEPDGKLGPETQEKWDAYICNKMAARLADDATNAQQTNLLDISK